MAGLQGAGWLGLRGGRGADRHNMTPARSRPPCRWEVEVSALPYMSRTHKLAALFRLTFRRSSAQHPLLAGALGERPHCLNGRVD